MPTLADLLFVAGFAVALPLWDYLVLWPATERRMRDDPARARQRLWTTALIYPWVLVAAGAAIWVANDRAWNALGLVLPTGWRLWTSAGLALLLVIYYMQAASTVARDPATRASVQRQLTGELANVLPRTRAELSWFSGVSLTAGFCEEFLYRGYLVWALSPWIGWWGAAIVSLLLFAVGHAYQGWQGIVKTGVAGALFTAVVAVFGSLWPAMILHALVDLGSGVIAWLTLRTT